MSKNILYLRNFASQVNANVYNLQEIGLCKSLVRKGFNCDIIYYSEKKGMTKEVIYENGNNQLRIFWMSALKLLSNSVFFLALKKNFLNHYDLVITTEYNQVMTYLISRKKINKLALYHGPYKDNDKTVVQKIYDLFCLPTIINKVDSVFTKSKLSEDYLRKKGFGNVYTLGVGLDIENLLTDQLENSTYTNTLLGKLNGNKALLYVGKLEERRNIIFLLNVFKKLLDQRKDISLVIVGNGDEQDKRRYFDYAENLGIFNNIIYFQEIEQKYINQIYEHCDVFVFPTQYDIFGMVLLESMYLGVPIVSSMNGGSKTLIENEITGIIIDTFDEEEWVNSIGKLLHNETLRETIIKEASKRVGEVYSWETICDQLLEKVQLYKLAVSDE